MTKRFYLAADFGARGTADTVYRMMEQIQPACVCQSRWIYDEEFVKQDSVDCAYGDFADIGISDYFVMLHAAHPSTSGGKFLELGYAYGLWECGQNNLRPPEDHPFHIVHVADQPMSREVHGVFMHLEFLMHHASIEDFYHWWRFNV